MGFPETTIGPYRLLHGDALAVLPTFAENTFDACVADPPYGLGFMGQAFDKLGSGATMQAWHERWAVEVVRVLKPGAHCVAFGGTRTHHRLMCALEDAGFELRDTLMWIYGMGFTKSLDVGKALDKAAGAEREVVGIRRLPNGKEHPYNIGYNEGPGYKSQRSTAVITAPATAAAQQWAGYGTNLKPAWEPIILARKPLQGTVVENVLRWRTGVLNIDGCRVPMDLQDQKGEGGRNRQGHGNTGFLGPLPTSAEDDTKERWPANVVHDGSAEVLAGFPQSTSGSGDKNPHRHATGFLKGYGKSPNPSIGGDTGSAARFFYTAKASPSERGPGNTHPTVKPVDLMRWLVRLTCPPGGTVLDPFAGSGTTGIAAYEEAMRCVLIEREADYYAMACRRMEDATKQQQLFT